MLSVIQYRVSTIDPIDSDFIINEQCMNLSTLYSFSNVRNVMKKSEFMKKIQSTNKKDGTSAQMEAIKL